ncbi:MAG TPA: ankyrin repeat domain-containing protein [Gammaproteobacteria bacterium]|nr:ankyrin repeat domain-containing protein [Gammaproteobacteria bacterium]
MSNLLYEIRLLFAGLALGGVSVPAILWFVYSKYRIQLIVYNNDSIDSFYREVYLRLDDPLVLLCLLLPYLLLRLTLLLIRSKPSRSPDTATPLAQAAAKGREDLVRVLLTQGGDIDAGNSAGQTPLHLAADQGSGNVVRLLLEQGAMVDVVEKADGYTPLHYAALHGYTDLCEMLIRFGADPDRLTCNQDSPLHLAIKKGRVDVVGVLLKYRARLDIKNRTGMTPLQQAEYLQNHEIANLINQYLSESWPYLQLSRC